MITKLKENEIFVFGSNTLGHHGGGAAKQAYDDFGAIWGQGEGLQGQSYAFPTLDDNYAQRSDSELERSVMMLINSCVVNDEKTYLLTNAGGGIANYKPGHIKSLFKKFKLPSNLVLPGEWE